MICINRQIAELAKPKSEADFIKVLKLLYTENGNIQNSLIRITMDRLLENADYSICKSIMEKG